MKATTYAAFLLFFFFSAKQLPAQALPLGDAIKKGYLAITASGNGGHTGQCLRLKLENKTRKALDIIIPAGQLFEAADSNLQDLMVGKQEAFVLQPDKLHTADVYGFCVKAGNGSPGTGSLFSLGKMAEGHLLKVAQYLSDSNLHVHPSAQYAVWAVSDNERLEGVGDPNLTKFLADMLGKPMPEYHVRYQQPQDRLLPGQPANWREAMALNGLFYYTLDRDQTVNFGLYNESGELVHTLFKNRLQRKGYHKFRFEFEIRGLQKGKYFARLTSANGTLKELEVEF